MRRLERSPSRGEPVLERRTADRLIERCVATDRLNRGDDGEPYESIANSRVPARGRNGRWHDASSYRELLLPLLPLPPPSPSPPPPATVTTTTTTDVVLCQQLHHHHHYLKNSTLPSWREWRIGERRALLSARVQTTEIPPEDTRHHVQLYS